MTNETTTQPTPAATLTEGQLWSEFTASGFPIHCSHTGQMLVYEMPNDLIADEGENGMLETIGDQIASDLALADSPSAEIDNLIEDLERYIQSLCLVRNAFESLRAYRLIEADESASDTPPAYSPRAVDEAA